MTDQVVYAASPQGYAVQVWKGGKLKLSYAAGNCRFDSQVYLDESDPAAVPENTLLIFAKQTALDLAAEHDIAQGNVYHDPIILP